MICLKIIDEKGNTAAQTSGEEEVNLVYTCIYEQGDRIVLETEEKNLFVWLQLDDALGKSMVYIKGNVEYPIPFGEKRSNLSPKAFWGNRHLITARKARDYEINQYRNLAFSVTDHHGNTTYFPHVSANVETRGESVFAAQNAVDGVTSNTSHGEWPYESWGINQQDDAKFKLDFGRKVRIDRIIVYIRADFPHDNWWRTVDFTFSDGSCMTVQLEKTKEKQEFLFQEKIIEWMELGNLKKSDEPSPFPALSQLEVYGVENE